MEAFRLMKELKLNLEQESQYLPKESGLKLIESNSEVNQPQRPGFEQTNKPGLARVSEEKKKNPIFFS